MPKVTKQKIGKATKPTKLVVVSPSLDEIAMYDLDGKKIAGCNFSKENSRVTGLESISLGNRKILCSSVTRTGCVTITNSIILSLDER